MHLAKSIRFTLVGLEVVNWNLIGLSTLECINAMQKLLSVKGIWRKRKETKKQTLNNSPICQCSQDKRLTREKFKEKPVRQSTRMIEIVFLHIIQFFRCQTTVKGILINETASESEYRKKRGISEKTAHHISQLASDT